MRALRAVGAVRLDGRRQLAVSEHVISAFFDVYLRGAPAVTLQRREGYRELEDVR